MTIAMQPIYTQTVGSGGAISVGFNNIPQTFTDLKVVVSARSTQAGTNKFITYYFNATQGTSYSSRRLTGDGSSAASSAQANDSSIYINSSLPAASITANTFGNLEIYIPNYTSSNFKQVIIDAVLENNATTGYQQMMAGLFRSTSPITSMVLEVGDYGNNYAQYSTFSLYGITKG